MKLKYSSFPIKSYPQEDIEKLDILFALIMEQDSRKSVPLDSMLDVLKWDLNNIEKLKLKRIINGSGDASCISYGLDDNYLNVTLSENTIIEIYDNGNYANWKINNKMAIVNANRVPKENPYEGLTKDSSNEERLNAFFKDLQKSMYPVFVDCHLLGMKNFNNEQAFFEASLIETGFVELIDNPNEQNKFKLKPKGFIMIAKYGSYLNYIESKKTAENPVKDFLNLLDEKVKVVTPPQAPTVNHFYGDNAKVNHVEGDASINQNDVGRDFVKASENAKVSINEESDETKKLGKKNYRVGVWVLIVAIIGIIVMIGIYLLQR